MNYELEANKYNKNCLFITAITLLLAWIFNELGIFIISKPLARIAFISSLLIFIISLVILHFIDLNKPWVKYFIVLTEATVLALLGVFLTYHIVLYFAVPFLMAAHYRQKKLSYILFVFSCITVIVDILVGYQLGICDMNMVAFTYDTIKSYGTNHSVTELSINYITPSIAVKLFTFFALPRIGTCFVFLRMSVSFANTNQIKEDITEQATYEGEHDKMTNVYNKNKYLSIVKEYSSLKTPSDKTEEEIGVLYFDINDLKKINDTYNHDMGDKLIKMAAQSLNYASSDDIDIYRIGGDEFIMIIHECNIIKLKATIKVWRNALRLINEQTHDLTCSMAVGCACGPITQIKTLVEDADKNMYIDKKEIKKQNQTNNSN